MTRKKAIEILKRNKPTSDPRMCGTELCEAVDMAIEAMEEPEQKKGQWILKRKWQSGRWIKWFECSICGEKDYNVEVYEDMPFIGLSNFCPQCGADMRGE